MHLLRAFNDRRRKRPTAPAAAPSAASSDDWDAPYKHDAAAHDTFVAKESSKRDARKAELADQAKPAPYAGRPKVKPPSDRLSSYGDE
jgi:hypothetical protein